MCLPRKRRQSLSRNNSFYLFFYFILFLRKKDKIKVDHGKNISFLRNDLKIKKALPLSTARPNRPKSYFVCFFEQTCLLYHFQFKSLTQRQQKKITVNYLLQKEQVNPGPWEKNINLYYFAIYISSLL
jgi:hypothetical protein